MSRFGLRPRPGSCFLRRSLHRLPLASLLVLFLNSGCDLSVFCYRMGVGIFTASRARFSFSRPGARIPVACSNLFSTFSTRFSSQKS